MALPLEPSPDASSLAHGDPSTPGGPGGPGRGGKSACAESPCAGYEQVEILAGFSPSPLLSLEPEADGD